MLCVQNYAKELNASPSGPPPVAVRRKRSVGRSSRAPAPSGLVSQPSSCSEGSLLSCSEPDDEQDLSALSRRELSAAGSHSTGDSEDADGSEPPGGIAPLSHSAARHKMAVRPKRTHGVPRRSRPSQAGTALPTTPEVNEEATRSVTPEVISSTIHHSTDAMKSSSEHSTSRHIITTSNMRYEKTESIMQYSTTSEPSNNVPKETRHKSSSLPPGLALSQMVGQAGASPMKLSISSSEELGARVSRSKSNAQKKDSSDTDDSLSFNEQKQTVSERNLSHTGVTQGMSMFKNADGKFSNVLTGELQKRFGSVGEDEELLSSGNFETAKSRDKIPDQLYENVNQPRRSSGEKNKSKNHENEEHHSNKKEESFFGRLLLRRSGKKNKKDAQNEKEDILDDGKKQHHIKEQQSYKTYSSEYTSLSTNKCDHGFVRQQKMTCADQHAHKSIGQKVFSNQNHKRIDPRGGYVNDPMIQESMTNFSKRTTTEYGMNDMKHFSEREKMNNEYTQNNLKVREDFNLRRLSSENVSKGAVPHSRLRQRMEPLDIPASPDAQRKPVVLPRTSSQESKGFFPSINQGKVYPSKDLVNGSRYTKNNHPSAKQTIQSEEFQFTHAISPKIKMSPDNPFGFASQGKIASEQSAKQMSCSVSPPKSVWPNNYEPAAESKSSSQGSLDPQALRNSKSDYETRYFEYPSQLKADFDEQSKSRPKIAGLSSYQQKISHIGNQMDSDTDVSFPDSARNPVIKSQSFRLNSDITPLASHQDMPSLPPMFGISESSMDSWESTYKKHLKEASEAPTSLELGSDSLMSFNYNDNNSSDIHYSETNVFAVSNIADISKDSITESVPDTLDPNLYQKHVKQMTHYTKNNASRSIKTRDTDISRIEANIDSIIGSPKPLNCIALKSSSLDSVKSYSDKMTDQNRKAVSNESISNNKIYINQPTVPDVVGSVSFNQKQFTIGTPIAESEKIIPNSPPKSKISSNGLPVENHVSVTVLNSVQDIPLPSPKVQETKKEIKQEIVTNVPEKIPTKIQAVQKDVLKTANMSDSGVPEFMKIQLNKVDQKPVSNVVLSTGVMNDSKNNIKTPVKIENNVTVNQGDKKKSDGIERSVSHEPKKSERFIISDLKKSESTDKTNLPIDVKEIIKPQRKFSSEDVEILEKSETTAQNVFNVPLKKTGSQTLLNRSTELLSIDNSSNNKTNTESKANVPSSLNLRKFAPATNSLPPPSPTAHKNFIKKKSGTLDMIEVNHDSLKRQSYPIASSESGTLEKSPSYTHSMKRMSSHELLVEQNSRIDRSSSSSDDSNLDSTVVLRKKSLSGQNKSGGKKDDEPELMKVFARRSLKLKDSETEAIQQDLLRITSENNDSNKEELNDDKKNPKLEFNTMTRSRDSDKENEADSPKDERKKSNSGAIDVITDSSQCAGNKLGGKPLADFRKHSSETAELMQAQRMPKKLLDSNPVSINNAVNLQPVRPAGGFGFGSYQRSVSVNNTQSQNGAQKTDNKIETTNSYKKDVSDSTPEKRFRNRSFPDSNNESENKNAPIKADTMQYSVDTSSLPKRIWNQKKVEENNTTNNVISNESGKGTFRKSITTQPIDVKGVSNKINLDKSPSQTSQEESEKAASEGTPSDAENGATDGETDASPQFKGILQMKAEWERRAKEAAMTK